jgi:hypothetical protein
VPAEAGRYTLAVFDTDGRVIEAVGLFPTPAYARAYAEMSGLGDVRVVPHRPAGAAGR